MVKNLLNVASPTMNPPHSHLPIGCPTTKITLTKFVITVAAQKLICPQGNTYPTKAVRKVKRNTTTPVSQTLSYSTAVSVITYGYLFQQKQLMKYSLTPTTDNNYTGIITPMKVQLLGSTVVKLHRVLSSYSTSQHICTLVIISSIFSLRQPVHYNQVRRLEYYS